MTGLTTWERWFAGLPPRDRDEERRYAEYDATAAPKPAAPRRIGFESEVTWNRAARGYPVQGVVKCFFDAWHPDGPLTAAVIVVTRDAGLYRRGTVTVAALAELEAVA